MTATPENGSRGRRRAAAARGLRAALVALGPPLIAFALDLTLFRPTRSPWLLMIAAVIVSAAHGGMVTGLVTTIVSTVLVWWFLIPPVRTFEASDPSFYLLAAIFIAVGYAVSLLHERLRRATDRITSAARENQISAALIENSLDFIGIADPQGNPLYLNPAGRRMVELPDDVDIARTRIAEYYPADVRAFAQETIVGGMIADGKWEGETTFRNWRTDESIPVLDTHFLIRDRSTRRVIGMGTITRDISAQKAQRDALERTNQRLATTMRELAESQRSLQGILDYSPNAIVIKSLEGRYLVVNNGFSAFLHLANDVTRGKTDADLFPPSLAQRLRANDEQALRTHEAVVTEESLELDGNRCVFVVTEFPLLDEADAIVALCSIWTDITERKRDEEVLRRVAGDLRTAQRVAHVGSWHWDTRTGNAEWSEELYHIFGLEPAQPRRTAPLGTLDAMPFTAESRARARAAVEKTLADGSPHELDLEFNRPDGTQGWIGARGEAVRDESGRIVAINGSFADITKLKELQRLRDEWTSVIAHDLRQPIGTIMMASDVLPDIHGPGMPEKERALVLRIHSASRSLKRMVDDLLDMSLLEANRLKLDRRSANPSTLVRETIERLRHLPGIERVHLSEDAKLPPIHVDIMRVEQVLTNLITNAIKYGDEHADITVRLEQRANDACIAVTNRGLGIPREELPRLFNRFMRSKSTRGSGTPGLGLGLYIAKGVVEAHSGQLWAESTPGEETTFHVTLPMSEEKRAAA